MARASSDQVLLRIGHPQLSAVVLVVLQGDLTLTDVVVMVDVAKARSLVSYRKAIVR